MRGIFVGGCHIVGKPHGSSYGFVRLLWKRWRSQDRKVHFDLLPYAVSWEALFRVCRDALVGKPDFIVLNIQSGLVLPTWERTLQRRGFKPGQPQGEPTENWFAPLRWEPEHRGRIYWTLKKLGILFLGGQREDWERIENEWARLAAEFAASPVRVIVMTPTPVRDDYFVRGTNNLERIRKMVLSYSGYEVCDVYPSLRALGSEGLWYDGQHLSKKGHHVIAELLGDMFCSKGDTSCRESKKLH